MEQLDCRWTDFYEIYYLSIFESLKKIKVSLKPDKNNVYFTWRPIYISAHISLSSSYNENCFTQNCRENQNKRFVFNNLFF